MENGFEADVYSVYSDYDGQQNDQRKDAKGCLKIRSQPLGQDLEQNSDKVEMAAGIKEKQVGGIGLVTEKGGEKEKVRAGVARQSQCQNQNGESVFGVGGRQKKGAIDGTQVAGLSRCSVEVVKDSFAIDNEEGCRDFEYISLISQESNLIVFIFKKL